MIFLLDTNAVSPMVSGHPTVLAKRVGYRPSDLGISAISAFEFRFGIAKGTRVEFNRQKFEQLGLAVVPFDDEDAQAAASIRLDLSTRGTPIGPYDLLI